jgi:hypothetical protein
MPEDVQGSGDRPVLRLHLAEGAFGAIGFVAGAFDGELGGSACPLTPIGVLVGGGQGEGELGGLSAASIFSVTAVSTVDAAMDRQVAVVSRSARREHSSAGCWSLW